MHRRVLYTVLGLGLVMLAACTGGQPVNPSAVDLPAAIFPPPTPAIATPDPRSPSLALPSPTPLTATFPEETADTSPMVTEVEPSQVKEAHLIPQPPPTVPIETVAVETAVRLSAADGVPQAIVAFAQDTAAASNGRYLWVDDPTSADLVLQPGAGQPLITWVYALAVPFATIADETTTLIVQQGWQTGSSELGAGLLTPEVAGTWTAIWGQPSPAPLTSADLMGELWAARPAWTILPFHQLRPEFKVLAIDGQSPLSRTFDASLYPLTVMFGVTGDEALAADFVTGWTGPGSNYDPGRLSSVAMTGVTALVRATAYQMEQRGVLWPGEEVAPVLQNADIAHISNEVAFMPDCPYPDPYGGTIFCSHERYFELLQHLGTDVIELTGNHVNDYGRDKLAYSLGLYEQAGMRWFGGGRNLADASAPAVFEHNGNRIAFLGCNPVGPANAWATAEAAGSRPCGPELAAQIGQLASEGHVVIATLQYTEYYQYAPTAQQEADFLALAEAGAAAVSGSQAHHAQSFGFKDGSFIHYGPGNLFFDQMDMMGTRQTFVDTYWIYDNRLINVELWTGLIENWARPRLMTPEERAELLRATFQASGW